MKNRRIGNLVDTETYSELRAFYANQLGVRDCGDTAGWLDAFDPDGTLKTNSFDDTSAVGKSSFAPAIYALDRSYIDAGIQRRHVVSNFLFTRHDAGTVHARSYGLLVTISGHEDDKEVHSAVVSDLLVRSRAGWRVKSREIFRDDLACLQPGPATTAKPTYPAIQKGLSVTRTIESNGELRFSDMYCLLDQFYAYQAQALDSGDVATWAATFTSDASVCSDWWDQPLTGRALLEQRAAADVDELGAAKVVRRHMVTNIRIEQNSPDVLKASSYVQIIDTVGGQTHITRSEIVRDEFAKTAGWLVSNRKVLSVAAT